jgi:hypothetical protein
MTDKYPPRRIVRNSPLARYLNKSQMCLWRWKRDPALKCPPTYEINGIEYNDLDEWDAWIKARVINLGDDRSRVSRLGRIKQSAPTDRALRQRQYSHERRMRAKRMQTQPGGTKSCA